jgi:signal transduction histidine kinase
MFSNDSHVLKKHKANIAELQKDLDQINKSLFDSTAHTAILLVNEHAQLLQSNNYFHEIFDTVMKKSDKISTLPITNTYGSCSNESWFDFLTLEDERMLPKVEMSINNALLYFTIISTVIGTKDDESDSKSFILSLTDITNVVELHNNEISISKELAYKQGIFDVTSEYIHNIGNIVTGAQHLSDRIIKNLEPMQFFFKYFDHIKEQISQNEIFLKDDIGDDYTKSKKKIEMSLNIIESSLTDTIKNVLEQDMQNLQKAIGNIATTIVYQQELYKTNQTNIDDLIKLSDVLEEINGVMEQQLINHDVLLHLDISPELTFKINRIHLFNGLLNLLKNSVHALDSAYSQQLCTTKELWVSARSVPQESSFFELDSMMSDSIITNEDIIIEVQDNGIGMDENTILNMFTQGFTTKTDGHGLGLHSFANFLTSCGHSITCESEGIGKGTKFIVTLSIGGEE